VNAGEPPVVSDASVTGWRVGLGDANGYVRLDIDLGVLRAQVFMTSAQARELAVEILVEQSPYLLFQPPNDSMKERRPGPTGHSRRLAGLRDSRRAKK
jgi:hypothetical protein